MRPLLDLLGVLFRVVFSLPGAIALAGIAGILFASRCLFGKRAGIAKLVALGYLLLVFLLWLFAVVPSSTDSLGYQWLPVMAATLPWSPIVEAIHWPDLAPFLGGLVTFLLYVVVCGGLNCLIFLALVWTIKRIGPRKSAGAA